MLKQFTSQSDYFNFLDSNKASLSTDSLKALSQPKIKSALFKMRKLRLDDIVDIIKTLYSSTGRPALHQAELFRSLILMLHFGYTSIDAWVNDLSNFQIYQYLIGSFDVPSVSSHYDFISRLSKDKQSYDYLLEKNFFSNTNKSKYKKPSHGEKLENFTPEDTKALFHKYESSAACDRSRSIYTLQSIFNVLALNTSFEDKLITLDDLILSGDGSALHVHSNPAGNRVLNDDETDDNRTHRYTALDADWGWDSDLEQYYFGYTFYNISYHNRDLAIDLPVFLSIEKASRHDALTSISATAQFLDINSLFVPKYICLDAASDAYYVNKYISSKGITPIIDKNKRRGIKKLDADLPLTDDGIPICPKGIPMTRDGYETVRNRLKFRCPLATGRIKSCEFKEQCSSSSYGRVEHIYLPDDPSIFGNVPYKSDEWKEIYKNRTSTERINNRVLNNYNLQHLHCRSKGKFEFFSIFAGINIHLDAQYKVFSN